MTDDCAQTTMHQPFEQSIMQEALFFDNKLHITESGQGVSCCFAVSSANINTLTSGHSYCQVELF